MDLWFWEGGLIRLGQGCHMGQNRRVWGGRRSFRTFGPCYPYTCPPLGLLDLYQLGGG